MPRPYGWLGTFRAMANPCEVHVAGAERRTAARVVDAVAAEAQRIEQKYSRYLSGNLVDAINTADGAMLTVDAETARLLDYADELYRFSAGSFDITSGVLRQAWQFDGGHRVPRASVVRRAMRHVGWGRVAWHAPSLQLEPGMEIDFGGIAKEYAVDRAAALAREIWPNGLINFGGDLHALGSGIDGGGWTVGIEGDESSGMPATRIELMHGALATSGNGRRYVMQGGRRYGHILDPRTGWPVEGAPRSVTVAAPACTHAGALATVAMLRGADAEAFLDAEGVAYWCLR